MRADLAELGWRLIVPRQWLSSGLQKGQPSRFFTVEIITIMEPTETIYVTDRVVACDGGKLGHPMVYLNFSPKGEIVCPYCSRRYVLRAKRGEAAAS